MRLDVREVSVIVRYWVRRNRHAGDNLFSKGCRSHAILQNHHVGGRGHGIERLMLERGVTSVGGQGVQESDFQKDVEIRN